ncbi:Dihydrolipoyl dehydrogenase [Galdieria sulphuraria]|nr:Dihydrolipoyl dehydrogenase [Galdieria sulphuraria]
MFCSFVELVCWKSALQHTDCRQKRTSARLKGQALYCSKFLSSNRSSAFISFSGFRRDSAPILQFRLKKARSRFLVVCEDKREFDYDVAIIGAGVGGHGAAMHAVANGLKTCIFEAHEIGGTCVNRGCVPSKALLSSSRRIRELSDRQHLRSLGVDVANVSVDRQAVADHAQGLANRIQRNLGNSLKALGVEVIHSRAKCKSSQVVELANGETISAKDIILAPGSVPFVPPGIEVDDKTVFTSDHALKLEWIPSWIAIIGSGYIGLEFSDVYSSLGAEVTFVEALPNLIPGFDPEISRVANRLLIQDRPIEYYTHSLATKIVPGKPVHVVLSDAHTKMTSRELQVDAVLVATGRKPNTQNIGLETFGEELARGGFIPTNEYMQVMKASMQGISAIENIMGNRHRVNHRAIPAACFTHPEIAYVGLTEPQAKEEASQHGFKLEKSVAYFRANSKALAEMEGEGMAKILFNRETGELLGCHMIGIHASDLIQEAANAIANHTSVYDLSYCVHTHPTLSEVLDEAFKDARRKTLSRTTSSSRV